MKTSGTHSLKLLQSQYNYKPWVNFCFTFIQNLEQHVLLPGLIFHNKNQNKTKNHQIKPQLDTNSICQCIPRLKEVLLSTVEL